MSEGRGTQKGGPELSFSAWPNIPELSCELVPRSFLAGWIWLVAHAVVSKRAAMRYWEVSFLMASLDSCICPFLRQCSPLLGTSSSRDGRIHRYKFILAWEARSLNSVALPCLALCMDERCWVANGAHWCPGTHKDYGETPTGNSSLKLRCLSAPG